MNKIKLSQLLMLVISISLLSMAVALMMRSNIGLGAWDAIIASTAFVTKLKVGYASIVLNGTAFLLQIIMLGKNFKKSQYLQILIILLFGTIINFFYYNIILIEFDLYISRFIMWLIGSILSAFAIAILVSLDIVNMPAEGLSEAISIKTGISFFRARFFLDILAVVLSLLVTFIFKGPLNVREATIIGVFVFNFFLKLFVQILEPKLKNI